MKKTCILWFTGLSGSGKTTIANRLYEFFAKENKSAVILDGDVIRATAHRHLGFTPDDIKKNNELIVNLCMEHKGRYDYVIVPVISPFAESRRYARTMLGEDFIEIYTKASLDNVIKKDVKGLYAKALKGEIKNFIGISEEVPYEEPVNPDVTLDTDIEDVETSVQKVTDYLTAYGRL